MSSPAMQFNKLYERHHRPVLAYCLRRTSEADAYDAASEVFAVAWRRLDDIPRDKELPWLYGVARRVLSRQWRGARRFARLATRVESQPRQASPDIATAVVQRDHDSLIHIAMAKLRTGDREILRLAAWEGLPHSEIAEVLDITVAAVDQRIHRAKKRLATSYDDLSATSPSAASEGPA